MEVGERKGKEESDIIYSNYTKRVQE